MIKNAVATVVIAAAVALLAPRDPREAAALVISAGAVLFQLGFWLDPPAYDAGPIDDHDESDIETERAAAPTRPPTMRTST